MSKVQETLIVGLGRVETEIAFRKVAMSIGTIRELEEGHFQIKEVDNGYSAGTLTMGTYGMGFSTDKTTNPATVDVYINTRTSNETEVTLIASCFGAGPVQNNHCKAKLSTVKSAIIVAVADEGKNCGVVANAQQQESHIDKSNKDPAGNTSTQSLISIVKGVSDEQKKQQKYEKNVTILSIIAVAVHFLSNVIQGFVPAPIIDVTMNFISGCFFTVAAILTLLCSKINKEEYGIYKTLFVVLVVEALILFIRVYSVCSNGIF